MLLYGTTDREALALSALRRQLTQDWRSLHGENAIVPERNRRGIYHMTG